MFLVQFSDNWADEMDIEGCKVMSEIEYEAYLAIVKKAFEICEEIYFYVGTNEFIVWEDVHEFEKTLFVRHITEEEADVLKTFGFDNYGHFPLHCFEECMS